MKSRRDYFIPFCQQEDCRGMNRLRILNAVEVSRDLQCDWTGQQPQVPPSKAAKDYLTEGHWIMQNQPGDGTLRSDVERSGCADACAKRHDWFIVGVML